MGGLRDGLIVAAFVGGGAVLMLSGEYWWGVFLLIVGVAGGWEQLGRKGE